MLIADKSEFGFNFLAWDFLLSQQEALDVTILSEDFGKLLFIPRLREVLNVDVVAYHLGVLLVPRVVWYGNEISIRVRIILPNSLLS